MLRFPDKLDAVPVARMPQYFIGAPMLISPEERHVFILALFAQHVGGSYDIVLLGQAPVLDAHRAAGEGEGRDITGGPQPVRGL
ncbi:hypothetical protein D3C81_1806890 [compost metagenome]